MTQILKKAPSSLTLRAGAHAQDWIKQHGLHAKDIDLIPGAAGGPKGIGLLGLDQAIFGDFLPRHAMRRTLIGSSIGSWRFASMLALGAKAGSERLAELYTQLYFHKKMSRSDIAKLSQDMLSHLIDGQAQKLVEHPDYHLTVLSVKSQHIFNSDRSLPLWASVTGIIGSNLIARKHNRLFMQRVVSQPALGTQFSINDDEFKTLYQTLTTNNVMQWLMASASIPGVMSAVRDIPDAPKGSYRDGGLIDYHIDLPFASQGIVLYPHFTDSITPGWFDKALKRTANPANQTRTLLISPSAEYLASLPLGRLPDRRDFNLKGLSQQQRIAYWQQSVAESQRMGDEFLEMVEKQNFAQYLHTL